MYDSDTVRSQLNKGLNSANFHPPCALVLRGRAINQLLERENAENSSGKVKIHTEKSEIWDESPASVGDFLSFLLSSLNNEEKILLTMFSSAESCHCPTHHQSCAVIEI